MRFLDEKLLHQLPPAPGTRARVNGLADALRALGAARDEARLARSTCRALLQLHKAIREGNPGLPAAAGYGELVARHLDVDAPTVDAVLERAEESFARWPLERPLTLRDVIHYLVARDCLAARPKALGLHINLAALVAQLVPARL